MTKTLTLLLFLLSPAWLAAQTPDSLAASQQIDSLIKVSRDLAGKQDFEQALTVHQEAERLALLMFGESTIEYGKVCRNYGGLNYHKNLMESYVIAQEWFNKSINILEKNLGENHVEVARSSYLLGITYWRMGLNEKALLLLEKSKNVYKEQIYIADYLNSLNALGVVYKDLGQYEHAEDVFLEALRICESTGNNSLHYANVLLNLSVLYDLINFVGKIDEYYIKAMSIYEKELGSEHPYIAITKNRVVLK